MTEPTLPGEEPVAYAITWRPESGVPALYLSGELDLRAATELREELLRALGEGSGSVILDMGELAFLDSTIISVLIMAKKRAETAGGEVRLRRVPDRVRRVFSITGIDSLFQIE